MTTILIIDDDTDLRRGVRAVLSAAHFDVLEADGVEAGLARVAGAQPDLVLCDLHLGRGLGWDVLKELRHNPATASLPLILITASDDDSAMRRSMDLGADDFLHKPFTGPQLLAAVEARLKKQRAIQAQTNQVLRDIEARHRLLFESASDAVMVLAPPAWKYIEANAATLRIFGVRTKAEFLAIAPWEVSPEYQPGGSASAEQAKTMIETALRDGSHYFEWSHRRLNGEVFPATVLLARMELAGQTLLQATVRDITERKRMELLLRARADLAETSRGGNLDELLQKALDSAEQMTGSCIGFFHFVDADQQNLTLQTWSTNTLQKMCTAEGKGRHYPISQAGVWVDCIRARAPVIHNDYASLPHRKGLPAGHAPVMREAVVPIERDGLVVCIMGVGNKPSDYTADDVRFLEDLASVVADYAIRLRAEQALQASERRYQVLAESSPAGVFRTDADGQTTYVNTRWCELAGLPADEAKGEGWLKAVHPEDREELVRGWTAAQAAEGIARADYRFVRADGAVAWVMGQATPERDATGQLLGYVGTVTDITERKRTEDALRDSESKFRALFRSMTEGVALHEVIYADDGRPVDYRILDVNPSYEKHTGIEAERARGRLAREAYGTAVSPYLEVFEEVTRTGKAASFDTYFAPLQRHFQVSICPITKGQFATIFTDVTGRKRAEDQLRKLSLAVEQSPASVVITDTAGRIEYVNPKFCAVTGYAASEVIGQNPRMLKSGDNPAELYRKLWQTITSGQEWRGEFRNRKKSGELFWEFAVVSPIKNERGDITHFLAIKEDITARKQVEQELVERSRVAAFAAEVGKALTQNRPFNALLQDCTELMVQYLDAAFARIWVLNAATQTLELQASAGLYTHLDGPHSRVPVGHLKIGWIAQEKLPHLTNDVLHDPHVGDKEWARREQMVAFAGHPLMLGGQLMGVMALFARKPLSECVSQRLASVAKSIAASIYRHQAEVQRKLMEVQLRHAQKLESIGQLAAGIAHEINSPMQYIGDNTRFLQDAFGELRRVLAAFQVLSTRLRAQPGASETLAPVEAAVQAADLDYLLEEVPRAIDQSLQGVERVIKIVRAMKEFSHPGVEQKTVVDLNHAIESTITVARNEWKYVADLEMDFDPQLPLIPCLPGEFNQVILNLIINAAHAIADVIGPQPIQKGKITVSTRSRGDWVEIRITDTGTGIPEAIRDRVFDPFFTTKPVGKGSGQGLAIARSVILDKHGGTLTFETEPGRGTSFVIRLPSIPPETMSPTSFA